MDRRTFLRGTLGLSAGLVATGLAAPAASAAVLDLGPLPQTVYFPETGQALAGEFLRFWIQYGRVSTLGRPISPEFADGARRGQWFDNARLERDASAAGGEVTLAKLGREAAYSLTDEPFQRVEPVQDDADRRFFATTGHILAFSFKHYWETKGGMLIFGPPISEEFQEDGRTVQYFENTRLEYWPGIQGNARDVGQAPLGRWLTSGRGRWFPASPRPTEAVDWSERLDNDLRERLRRAQATLAEHVTTPLAPLQMAIAAPSAETYWAPGLGYLDAGPVYARHIYRVNGLATGDSVNGDRRWYRLELDRSFLPADHVKPFVPPPPPRTWKGRWVDVNLTSFYLTVYDNEQPLRSALIIAGRKERTPPGVFSVRRRVRSETMNSATVGIPKGHPEYYYLKDVAYTQYFTGEGHAIHGNYWVHPSRFGQFISNGCIGLRNHDAAWVWDLTQLGTTIHIHF